MSSPTSLESEAATALALRLARAFEAGAPDAETALARLVTPAVKYWVCKRAPQVTAEAMEVIGGNGYVEECVLPRLYREAPLNSIWEGSGNVMCLDVLRAARREPAAAEALLSELGAARSADSRLDRHIAALKEAFREAGAGDRDARRVASGIAIALAASLLLRHAPPSIGDAYCASRLDGGPAGAFGDLPASVDPAAIISRRFAW